MAIIKSSTVFEKIGFDEIEPEGLIGEFGYRYVPNVVFSADKKTQYQDGYILQAFAKYKLQGEIDARETTKEITQLQFQNLTGEDLQSAIIGYIKTKHGIE